MKQKTSFFEWAILVIFIVLEIIIFYIRIISPDSELNQISKVLLGTFEVIFSLYIGYFLQRIDSAKQFQESLKNYGLSAYRRIMDIKISINRTINQIDKMSVSYPKDKTSDISVLRLILESTLDTVESSVSDWGDIIGTEIRKKERVEQLQDELVKKESTYNLSTEDVNRIDEIKSEIKKISSELPLSLKDDYIKNVVWVETANIYLSYLESTIARDKFLTFYVKLLPETSSQQIEEMAGSQPIIIFMGYAGEGKFGGEVLNKDKSVIGMVINPIVPHEYEIFYQTLGEAFNWLRNRAGENTNPYYSINDWKYGGMTNDKSMIMIQIPLEEGYFPRG